MNEHGGVAYKNIRKKTSLHLSKQKSQSSPCLACNFFFDVIILLLCNSATIQFDISASNVNFFCYPKSQIMPTSSFSLLSRVVRIVETPFGTNRARPEIICKCFGDILSHLKNRPLIGWHNIRVSNWLMFAKTWMHDPFLRA